MPCSVVLSVPNARRTWRGQMEPLEFPPHHVTRWTEDSLAALARQTGLVLEDSAFEPCPWETARHWLEKTLHSQVQSSVKLVGDPLGRAVGFCVSRALLPSRWLYGALEVSRRARLTGLAMACVLRVP